MIELGILKNDKFQKNGIKIVVLVIAFIIVAVMVFAGPSISYKKKIKELKTKNQVKYFFFPDQFPEGSTNRKYVYFPNMLQGSGHLMISFTMKDPEYISSISNSYTNLKYVYTFDEKNGSRYDRVKEANVYRYYDFGNAFIDANGYEHIGWVNNDGNDFNSPIDPKIKNKEKDVLFLIYDYPSKDPDSEEKGGIIVDSANSKVYFWADN